MCVHWLIILLSLLSILLYVINLLKVNSHDLIPILVFIDSLLPIE